MRSTRSNSQDWRVGFIQEFEEIAKHEEHLRNRPLAGNVTIAAPAGWSITPGKSEFSGLKRTQSFDLPVQVRRGKGPGIDEGDEIAWGVADVHAPEVWSLGFVGTGVLVGMIDTGVNYNHLDLQDHMCSYLYLLRWFHLH